MEFAHIKLLPWDSEFFGVTAAKNLTPQLEPAHIDAMLLEGQRAGVRCLYCEVDPNAHASIARLEEAGARLVEFRLVMHRKLGESILAAKLPIIRGELRVDDCIGAEDMAQLQSICRSLAAWSRFAADAHFGLAASERLYERWLDASLHGSADVLLVARHGGRVVGFTTLKQTGALVQLVLIGVDPQMRDRGVGRMLMEAAFAWSAAHGAEELELITQGRNVRALRFYERSGLTVKQATCFFHKWYDENASG